jgi:hypothetical protein
VIAVAVNLLRLRWPAVVAHREISVVFKGITGNLHRRPGPTRAGPAVMEKTMPEHPLMSSAMKDGEKI